MNKRISKIDNGVQDRNSVAWKKLCDYVDKVAIENPEEFSPLELKIKNYEDEKTNFIYTRWRQEWL